MTWAAAHPAYLGAKVEDWDFIMRLNLRSAFLCTREAAAHMRERRSGRIVNLSSGAREGTPWTAYYVGNAAYAAAKPRSTVLRATPPSSLPSMAWP